MLEIKNLSKTYQNGNGIQDICLQCKEGTVYSIIGPNGAGKTTFLNSVSGILAPETGSVILNGKSTLLRSCKQYIGFGFSEDYHYPNMTVLEILRMVCEIKWNGKYESCITPCLKELQLYEHRNKLIRECSQGMKKKTGILISFLGNPPLILLDEPTDGVDTSGILVLKNWISKAKASGSTVIVASHILDFVTSVADEHLFLKNGRIIKFIQGNSALESEYTKLYLL